MSPQQHMLSQLNARKPGFSLPRSFYCDPEIYRLDLENIFYKDWLFAGHACEIKEPGEFFTLQIGDYPGCRSAGQRS